MRVKQRTDLTQWYRGFWKSSEMTQSKVNVGKTAPLVNDSTAGDFNARIKKQPLGIDD